VADEYKDYPFEEIDDHFDERYERGEHESNV
jgi:hypothetical protein